MSRRAALRRTSRETDIILALDVDGGPVSVDTGIGFLDHLITSLSVHSGWALELRARGDTLVDDHHTAEDCAICLGEALAAALSSGPAPRRFGYAYAPMDEALARAVVDLSGRPYCVTDLGLGGASLGALAGENVAHFVTSLAMAARINLHLDVLRGDNAHHRAEAAFKALALALREATSPIGPKDKPAEAGEGVNGAASAKGKVCLKLLSPEAYAAEKEAYDGRS